MREKYIERVKRLLALASSTTFLQEAVSARRKAQQLMVKYHIAESDLIEPTPPSPTPTPGPIYQPQYPTSTAGSFDNLEDWSEVRTGGWSIRWRFSNA